MAATWIIPAASAAAAAIHCGGLLVTIKRGEMANKLYNGITTNDTKNDTKNDTIKLTPRQQQILRIISDTPNLKIQGMATILNVSVPTIKRDIKVLTSAKRIIRVGSLKDGHWEVLI